MEITITSEQLRSIRLFVATPMYGGNCVGQYMKSVLDLQHIITAHGGHMKFFALFNESLVTRARNYCVDEFLRSDCTHLMFIDADVGFNPQDVLCLWAMSSLHEDNQYDVLCGPYPKKTIAWEKIKQAVDKGFADEDPNVLERFVGDYVFNPSSDQMEIRLDEPVEVLEGGTGFMMIKRETFEKFAEHYPELSYRPDHIRSAAFDGTREITAFFDTVICPDTKRYLSEDYMFCQWTRKMGLKVWMAPWMKLSHTGTYVFGGSLIDLAQIGAAATADPSKLKKTPLKKPRGS